MTALGAPQFDDARPALEVGDLGAALAFLTDVVGLPVTVIEGDPPTYAMVGADHAVIALVQVADPALPDGAACYVTMQGIDELVERLTSAGVELDEPLTIRPWGLRDLVVTIPGRGPKIAFGEPTV